MERDWVRRTLFLSTRLMITLLDAMVAACFASAASALSAFLCASFSARFWASRERVEVAAARASVCHIRISAILSPKEDLGGRERYLQTTIYRTSLDVLSSTNPDISSPSRRIRSTTSSCCKLVFIWEVCQGELWRGERTSGGSEQTVKVMLAMAEMEG